MFNSKLTLLFVSILYILISSLLIPTDSTADGNFHMGSIYCSTQNNALCMKDIRTNEYKLVNNIMPNRCQQLELKYRNTECDATKNNWENFYININEYPKIYYTLMSKGVVESNPKVSIFIIRMLNAFPFVVIAMLIWHMIGKNLTISYLIGHLFMSGIWGAQYYFTFNPSSWLLLGFTSIPFFVLGIFREKIKSRKAIFILVILMLCFLVVNSRPDGKYWLSLLAVSTLIVLMNHYRKRKSKLMFGVLLVSAGFVGSLFADVPAAVFSNYQGFEFANSYTDNYPITKINLFIHNILTFPIFNLGYFGMDNSLENIIPSLVYAFPLFVSFLILIKHISGVGRLHLYVGFLLIFTFLIFVGFFQLDYLFIYDKNIGYRYFMPIIILVSIFVINKKNDAVKIQMINPILLSMSFFTVLGTALNITKTSQGFNNGIYLSLASEYFNFDKIYVIIFLITLGLTHYYLLRRLIAERSIRIIDNT